MNTNVPEPAAPRALAQRAWWWEWETAALGLLVLGIYFTRLTAVPVCGEESRWAAGAREMIASGDWIVPRQQGTIFPERPPLTSWAMGLVGLARHDVDLVAIRLPSACAILALTWLIYAYARSWMSRLGSFSSAAAFATMGQVLGLGRCGESEAVFTLFTAAALLVWHWGYIRAWPRGLTWSLGYSLAALGALTKGPQAPVYFVAGTGVYLALQRDWRWLFSRAHVTGMGCFALIVGLWLVPFAILSDWHSVDDIWTGLAEDRFTLRGLFKHIATYPLETFGCLLPWSPLLCVLVKPSVRRSLWANRPPVKFLVTLLALTYPTVLLAAGARGRYFMPLYPCLAVLIGLMIEHCTAASASLADRLIWRRYLRVLGALALAAGPLVIALRFIPLESLADARQSVAFLVVWTVAALFAAVVFIWASLDEQHSRPQIAVLTLASFAGLGYAGAIVNSRIHGSNDLKPTVAQLKAQLMDPALVSLGRVYHRFAYTFDEPIRQIPWPKDPQDIPRDVTYFCFDRRPDDGFRLPSKGGDGRPASTGTLPFEWEVVAEIPCDPVKRDHHHSTVVIGRVRRVEMLAEPPLSRPVRR